MKTDLIYIAQVIETYQSLPTNVQRFGIAVAGAIFVGGVKKAHTIITSQDDSDPLPTVDFTPRDAGGGIDDQAAADDEIRTYEGQGEARLTVNWPSEVDPYWVEIKTGTGIDVRINQESNGIHPNDDADQFIIEDTSRSEWFYLEIYHNGNIGSQDVVLRAVSSGDEIERIKLSAAT